MIKFFHTGNLSPVKKASVYSGFGFLILSICLAASIVLNIFELESFAILGHSGVRTLAGIAVVGCLLAAIGFFDE
jgi:hypothetical protein